MTSTWLSLRARLTLIILVPLLLISFVVGLWAVQDAQRRAAEQFDRSLLSTTLAISRDTALSGGDALSRATRDLLIDTSGGPVFYHVYAPDGVFVTGYATPPVPPSGAAQAQLYYDGSHQGRTVRALRMTDAMTIDGVQGEFVFTVWQDVALRNSFVQDLSWRTFTVIATLLAALSFIVWFGVRVGLRPLVDLQTAIARRSPDELAPIKRPIPVEVQGTVGTLNALLGQVRSTFQAKDDFIANAAHQLRNPLAGVLAMSGAVQSAKSLEAAQERSRELSVAAQSASDLANALLAFERARSPRALSDLALTDLRAMSHSVADTCAAGLAEQGITFDLVAGDAPVMVRADAVLLEQAIVNLVENARLHGGATLSKVSLTLESRAGDAVLSVQDDGCGMSVADTGRALERFEQLKPSQGSGLGLSIVDAVAEAHQGRFELVPRAPGLLARMTLPLAG